jgi:hypothetical protein
MQPAPHLDLQPLKRERQHCRPGVHGAQGAIMDADIYGHREEIRLDERQLSRALGVSRTPIGEAMTLIKQLAPERRRSVISLRR